MHGEIVWTRHDQSSDHVVAIGMLGQFFRFTDSHAIDSVATAQEANAALIYAAQRSHQQGTTDMHNRAPPASAERASNGHDGERSEGSWQRTCNEIPHTMLRAISIASC